MFLTLTMASDSLSVTLLQMVVARPVALEGSSLMTVFRANELMSRNCSLSLSMWSQRLSTILWTWKSFTLFTRGPRLQTIA